jgi:superfamily II DNA helicase RecQ
MTSLDSSTITFDDSLGDLSTSHQPLLSSAETGAQCMSSAQEFLKKLFPDDACVEFCSEEQRLIVEHSLLCKDNFVGILPTGGGKSLAFLIPALAQPGCINLVVAPNKALMADLMRKTKTLGVPCCKWTSKSQDVGNAAIVFLAMESIISPAFKE